MVQNTINLKCKSCGGLLDYDKEHGVLVCPYCGSQEIIVESDEKIKQQTQFKEWEREDLEKEHKERERYKNSKMGKLTLVFAVLCGLLFVASINQISGLPTALRTIVFFVQTALFLMSYLIRKEIVNLNDRIKLKSIKLPTLLMAVGFILILAIIALSTL